MNDFITADYKLKSASPGNCCQITARNQSINFWMWSLTKSLSNKDYAVGDCKFYKNIDESQDLIVSEHSYFGSMPKNVPVTTEKPSTSVPITTVVVSNSYLVIEVAEGCKDSCIVWRFSGTAL